MARRMFCKILLAIIVVFAILFLSTILPAQGKSDNAFERVKQVQEKHTAKLMAIKGVVGTAVGADTEDNPDIKVLVEEPGVAGIPKKLDDVSVEVVVTGKIYALPKPEGKPGGKPSAPSIDPTARFPRPVPIGVSTGNEGEISSGTIGCRVKDSSGKVYALSNNHVYALENKAPIGSKVLQPGRYDTEGYVYNPDNVIGTLADFEPIVFSITANNKIDAAIAAIIKDENGIPLVGKATPSNGYGTPKSTTVSVWDSVGKQVQKYGRTTSLTKGTITGINATINVGYSSGTARFVNQVVVQSRSPFIKAGDSGSLLVTNPGKNPVGLLFAGDSSGKYAIANQIDLVLSAFGVNVDGE
jgi:hypothetical protein